ncbi:DUF2986 domain-containing protein [Bacillus cereus]
MIVSRTLSQKTKKNNFKLLTSNKTKYILNNNYFNLIIII